jgi:hypothetical protein
MAGLLLFRLRMSARQSSAKESKAMLAAPFNKTVQLSSSPGITSFIKILPILLDRLRGLAHTAHKSMEIEQIILKQPAIVPLAICFFFGALAGWFGHTQWAYFTNREKRKISK